MTWYVLGSTSSPSSPELVVVSWADSCLDGAPELLLKSIPTRVASFWQDSETGSCLDSRSGMTSEHSTENPGKDRLISSVPASRAHRSVSLENEKLETRTKTCGLTLSASFARYDPSTCFWKTSQIFLLAPTGTCTRYSDSWPRAGMTVDGIAYRRQPSAPIIKEIASGLLPTITARSYGTNQGGAAGRVGKVRLSLQSMARKRGGHLCPNFVEKMMDWPIGWTALEPLETGRFRQWLDSHGKH